MIRFSHTQAALERDRYVDPGPFAPRKASNLEDSPEQGCSFSHTQKSHGFVIEYIRPRDAPAVIPYLKINSTGGFFQIDGHLRGPGMANDIGQGLLKNPKQHRGEVLVRERFANPRVNVAPDARAVLEFIGLPLDGGAQAKVIQHPRPKLAGNTADRLNRRIDMSRQCPGFIDQRLQLGRQPSSNPG